jgi:hypothetical protein
MARRTRSEITEGYARLQRGKRHQNAFDGCYATDFLGVVDVDALLAGQRISQRLTEAAPAEERTEIRRRVRRVRGFAEAVA